MEKPLAHCEGCSRFIDYTGRCLTHHEEFPPISSVKIDFKRLVECVKLGKKDTLISVTSAK